MGPRFPLPAFAGLLFCLCSALNAAESPMAAEPVADVSSPASAGIPESPPVDTAGNTGLCPASSGHLYRKSLVMMGFPRTNATPSNPGWLHGVEQSLPRLLSQRLERHAAGLAQVHVAQGLADAAHQTDLHVAAQVRELSRRHRTQLVVSGQVLEMGMGFPDQAFRPGAYTRAMSGLHDFLHINTPFDKRERHFGFYLELRDGFTGQQLFSRTYHTRGKWKPRNGSEPGFDSPRFWKSHYGRRVDALVNQAGEELAQAIACQPYIARLDARPGQQQVIIHSGANNGLRAGDSLELYQLVTQQATGEYQLYDLRLVKRHLPVYLTEVYPSHSVARIASDLLLQGQYLALVP